MLAIGCLVIAVGAIFKLPGETSWLASLGYFLLVSVGGFFLNLLGCIVIMAVLCGAALAYEYVRDRIRNRS